MASRAFITLELGTERVSYYRLSGSPEVCVPQLAHWVMDMTVAATPLSSAAWLDWSGTAETGAGEPWDNRFGRPGDLEHEYVISDADGFRFVHRHRATGEKQWRTVLDVSSVAELLAAARIRAELSLHHVTAFRRRLGAATEAHLPGIPTVSHMTRALDRIAEAALAYDVVFAEGQPVIAPDEAKIPVRAPGQDERAYLTDRLEWCETHALISQDIAGSFHMFGDPVSAAEVTACTRGLLLEAYKTRDALALHD